MAKTLGHHFSGLLIIFNRTDLTLPSRTCRLLYPLSKKAVIRVQLLLGLTLLCGARLHDNNSGRGRPHSKAKPRKTSGKDDGTEQ